MRSISACNFMMKLYYSTRHAVFKISFRKMLWKSKTIYCKVFINVLCIYSFVYINMYFIRIIFFINFICHIDILIWKLGNGINETNGENGKDLSKSNLSNYPTNHHFDSHSYLTTLTLEWYLYNNLSYTHKCLMYAFRDPNILYACKNCVSL